MTIKIGQQGKEQDIPQESLTLSGISVSNFSKKSRSANNTLHVDLLPEKEGQKIKYDVISKVNYNWWKSMRTLQASDLSSSLSYIVGGSELSTYKVYLNPIPHGSTLRSDEEYYYNVNIILDEI